MLEILLFAGSLIFFIIALYRFPFGSFQNIIMLLLAGVTMYLATALYTIPQITALIAVPSVTANQVSGNTATNIVISAYNETLSSTVPNSQIFPLVWLFTYLYVIICAIFALVGLIMRAVHR